MAEVDIKVLGGLTITVRYTIGKAEPDVGYAEDYIADWWITAIAGRSLRKGEKVNWLEKRLKDKGELDNIEEKIWDAERGF